MNKVKRISLKYIKENDNYVVIKVQNVKGFKPQQILDEDSIDELNQSDIEVVIK